MNAKRPFIVAVDGPAGSGKSSVCAEAAKRLNWDYVNTGALYRAVGVLSAENGLNAGEDPDVVSIAKEFGDEFTWDGTSLYWGDRNLSTDIYSDRAGQLASQVATREDVRSALLNAQRRLALCASEGAIMDGRDIGSVVFPDANLKVFMTASIEQRARRRVIQLSGEDCCEKEISSIARSIEDRDRQDSGRKVAPLEKQPDAVLLDTSFLDLDQSVETLVKLIAASTAASRDQKA